MGMTVIKGAMNAGITGMGAMIMDGVGGIVGMTGSMTAAMMVGTMGVADGPLHTALRPIVFSAVRK